MSRLPFSLALVLLLVSPFPASAALTLGPEREVAPATTAIRYDGSSPALAASDDDFLSIWHSWDVNASFYTRVDASGRPLDDVGVRLPVALPYAAAAWNGTGYVVAGYSFADGMIAMPLGGEARVIVAMHYGSDVHLTFNGRVLLLTWVTQTGLTQTLHGVLLEPDLDVLRAPFVVTTRDVSTFTGIVDHAIGSSVAAAPNGDFIVAWERVPALTIVGETGDVRTGAAVPAETLQPTTVATDAGVLLLSHDRGTVSAQRVLSAGDSLSEPVPLVHAQRIAEFAATRDDAGLAVAWRVTTTECSNGPLFVRRFDAALQPPGDAIMLATASANGIAVAAGNTVIANWVEHENGCNAGRSVIRTAGLSEPAQTISAFIAPSSQKQADVASDGTSALVIWSERRDADPFQHVFGVVLDGDGNVRESLDIARGDHGRVAFGDGRYLVAWQQGSTIAARFLGEAAFAVAPASTPFEVAWNGERFVFVWNEGNALRSAFVSSSGFVSAGPSIENAGPLAGITAGPHGEIAALYRVETGQELTVRVATLRTAWNVQPTLAAAPRPCLGKRCKDYVLIAIGWSGRDYLVVWKVTEGPPYGSTVEGHRVRAGTTTKIAQGYNYSGGSGGELVWNGTSFVFVMQMPALQSSWPLSYVTRLSESGAALAEIQRLSATEVSSPPAVALLRADRAVVAYSRKDGLAERVYTRTVDSTPSPRRRAARH